MTLKLAFRFTLPKGTVFLLCNIVISKSNLLGVEQMLILPLEVLRTGSLKLHLPTFVNGEERSLRTYLHIVPKITKHFSSFFASVSLPTEEEKENQESPYSDQEYARNFAVRLHTLTHFPPRDMK